MWETQHPRRATEGRNERLYSCRGTSLSRGIQVLPSERMIMPDLQPTDVMKLPFWLSLEHEPGGFRTKVIDQLQPHQFLRITPSTSLLEWRRASEHQIMRVIANGMVTRTERIRIRRERRMILESRVKRKRLCEVALPISSERKQRSRF